MMHFDSSDYRGNPRLQRVANLELHWSGGKSRRFEDAPDDGRTAPLEFLAECRRLETLVLHVDESDKSRRRRPHEAQSHADYMIKVTAGQPNSRRLRSLRNLHGVDNLYLLRGLRFVRYVRVCALNQS